MVGDRKIGSAENVSWGFHLGMNSIESFISVVLWTVKLHLCYISIGNTFLMTCWALPIIRVRHAFSLGKINSVPFRKRPLGDVPAQTLTAGLEMLLLVNAMLIFLFLKCVFLYYPGTGKLKKACFTKV